MVKNILILGILTGFGFNAICEIIRVPQDHPTIGGAIVIASPGDTVLVDDGVYHEHNIVINKSLVLESVGGNTTIDGDFSNRIFQVDITDNDVFIINGFNIIRGDPGRARGGAIMRISGKIEVYNCVFANNRANGGIVDGLGEGDPDFSIGQKKVLIVNCSFFDNSAENHPGVRGVTAVRCMFYNNTAWNNPTVLVHSRAFNCVAYGNTGGVGSNRWTTGGASGGELVNCVLWANSGFGGQQIDQTSPPISVTYSIIEGGYDGLGNIEVNPLFRLSDKHDFVLLSNSPAIDSGDPSILDPDGSRSDIGAFGGPLEISLNPPVLGSQPVDQSALAGSPTSFCVEVENAGLVNYQWQVNGIDIPDANTPCLELGPVTPEMSSNRYRIIVSNAAGTVISQDATLTVEVPEAPVIITQPQAQTVAENSQVTLSVDMSGSGTFNYQWQKDRVNLAGKTQRVLLIPAASENDSGLYRVIVSSAFGATISDEAQLTVNPNLPPHIVNHPISQTPEEGASVTLRVEATGAGTLSYQWQLNEQNITGATSNTLNFNAIRPNSNGNYRVIVSTAYGTEISNEAQIAVIVRDNDGDGLSNYTEQLAGTNPNLADSDNDGLNDFEERNLGTNPLLADTDSDGFDDLLEVENDSDPKSSASSPEIMTIRPYVNLEFGTTQGIQYILQRSTHTDNWEDYGEVFAGAGGKTSVFVPAENFFSTYYRLRRI